MLDEVSSDPSDPMMYALQSGLTWDITELVSLRTALAYYGFGGLRGGTLDNSEKTNTLDSENRLVYQYDSFSPSIELKKDNPEGGALPYLSLSGEYIKNPDPVDHSEGYAVTAAAGYGKVKERGQWQIRYVYRYLAKDAWLDTFPDSDFYAGKTDVKGFEALAQLGLFTNVTLAIDYYRAERMTGARTPTDVLQLDVSASF